jgi:hypothetical protein
MPEGLQQLTRQSRPAPLLRRQRVPLTRAPELVPAHPPDHLREPHLTGRLETIDVLLFRLSFVQAHAKVPAQLEQPRLG